ncbi:MAG: hypothetical protein DME58_04205 [Verrucomicrobia bacterium]|nr:MAG: hypothetical protein DMF05_05535 [Verrucomicrobiota bacterium]PYK33396.1 MAG: hypothetical protein DME58_04205 [Verrucomicrobiota bacterium]
MRAKISAATAPHFAGHKFSVCRLSPGSRGASGEVAQLACEGRSNKEIAENACLSLQTVKKHLHSVFRKLQVPSRTRLVALAA